MNSQLPKLLQINERASRNVVRRAPLIDGLFRPEEEHGSSRKDEIVPPMRRRHSEMRDVRFQNRLTVFHFERQRFASVSIRSAANRIAMQRRCDSVDVPNVSAFSQGGSGNLLAFTALGQRFAPAKGQAFEFDYEHQ